MKQKKKLSLKIKPKLKRRTLAEISKPYIFWIVVDSFIMLANMSLALYFPKMIEGWIEAREIVFDSEGFRIFLFCSIGLWLLRFVSNFFIKRTSNRMLTKFRTKLYTKFINLPLSFYSTTSTEAMSEIIIKDSIALKDHIFTDLPRIFIDIIVILSCASLMFSIDKSIAGLMFAMIALFLLSIMPLKKWLYRNSNSKKQIAVDIKSQLNDTFENIKQVKSSGAEQLESEKGRKLFKKDSTSQKVERILDSMTSPIGTLVGAVLFVVVGAYALKRIFEGHISPGGIFSFVLYFSAIIREVVGVILNFTKQEKVQSSIDRICKIWTLKEENLSLGQNLESVESIEFRDVTFTHNDFPLLNNLNLELKKGEHIAIAGFSGSGKSTILMLLEKFFVPQDGEILVNKQAIDTFSTLSLRQNIAYMSQNTALFSGSLRENILYGTSEAISDEKIIEKLKQHQFDSIINELDKGLDSVIKDNGKHLSNGQKQKIALARLLMKDCDLILLDEPSSSLDSNAETLVENFIKNAKSSKIIITISQQISITSKADKIVVLEDKGVQTVATHDILMQSNETYQKLNNHKAITQSN